MRLSAHDRAKVQAALVAIHNGGHSTDPVTSLAAALMSGGTPPDKSYQKAFDRFCDGQPSFRATFHRIGRVVDAADDRTLSSYNVALAGYIAGDTQALDAVAPIADQACIALAHETGDSGFLEGVGEYASPEPQGGVTEAIPAAPVAPRAGHGMTGYRSPQTDAEASAGRQPYHGPRGAQIIGEPATYGPGPGPGPLTS